MGRVGHEGLRVAEVRLNVVVEMFEDGPVLGQDVGVVGQEGHRVLDHQLRLNRTLNPGPLDGTFFKFPLSR